ncbi:hypothetical protein H3H36_01295 [Duganella sp. FT3S]|uniref:PEP-CTERM protein-sorting domain-containing protein n=1 Tax=Rugamonas fusca TaxID=2758568 RepID=A0A7W2EDM1_9BURK|nr:hypothetical protein [Rugamonas fusca]MBA5603998.1 hypothetical protein [Rugamonas fusca]
MKVIRSFAVGVLTMVVLTAQAQTWTVTTSGIVDYGFDTTGVFGMAGQNLEGMSFSQAITVSTDTDYYQGERQFGGEHYTYGWGPDFKDVVTVSGHSVTFYASRPAEGMLMVTTDDALSPAGLLTQHSNDYINVENQISKNIKDPNRSFLTTNGFDQNFALALDSSFSGNARFSIYDERVANFSSQHIDTFTVTSSVPEPQGNAMFVGGLILLALWQRRKKKYSSAP